ncbi:MAG: flavin reductase family protein [Pseudomonadota bacterium]
MTHPLDTFALRRALGTFLTGVTVVATRAPDGSPRGFTANSLTSVSLDPPLVLVCLGRSASSHDVFTRAEGYSVNILARDQRVVSTIFASDVPDRFAHLDWQAGPNGNPIIEGAAAWLDCRMHRTVDAGDHTILIGEVTAFDAVPTSDPLGYLRGGYVDAVGQALPAGSAPAHRPTRTGVILERQGAVLLSRDRAGAMAVPSAARLGHPGDPTTLVGMLAAAGLTVVPRTLFALFEDDEHDTLTVIYRVQIDAALADEGAGAEAEPEARPGTDASERKPAANTADVSSVTFVPLDALAGLTFQDPADRTMLERYVAERHAKQFGLYVGNQASGRVQPLTENGEDKP